MCIAIAKLMGQEMPSNEILKNCFKNNKDGAGFAFNYDGQVIIKKGFMTELDFITAINDFDKKFNFKNCSVLIHTRITTHGGTSPYMCHPFPIVDDEGALKKTDYVSPYAIIHNGMISLTSSEATKKASLSDTAVFVEKYLSKIAQNKDWFTTKANIELIEDLIDSKMAIMNGQGEIIMTKGFTEEGGIFYSNTSYKDNYYKYSGYSDWTDLYGDDWYLKSKYGKNTYKYADKTAEASTKKKEDKADSTDIIKTIPLMKLENHQEVYFDEGASMDFDPHIDIFINNNSEIYCSYEKLEEKQVNQDLNFIGNGVFLDNKSYKNIEFKATNTIVESLLF